jgi:hypothetical protein
MAKIDYAKTEKPELALFRHKAERGRWQSWIFGQSGPVPRNIAGLELFIGGRERGFEGPPVFRPGVNNSTASFRLVVDNSGACAWFCPPPPRVERTGAARTLFPQHVLPSSGSDV